MDNIPPRLSSAFIAWMTTNFVHQCKGSSSLEIKNTTLEGGRVSFPLIYKREGAGGEKRDWWCKHFFFFNTTLESINQPQGCRSAEGHRHLGRWRLHRGATVVKDKSRRISDRLSSDVMHSTPWKKKKTCRACHKADGFACRNEMRCWQGGYVNGECVTLTREGCLHPVLRRFLVLQSPHNLNASDDFEGKKRSALDHIKQFIFIHLDTFSRSDAQKNTQKFCSKLLQKHGSRLTVVGTGETGLLLFARSNLLTLIWVYKLLL